MFLFFKAQYCESRDGVLYWHTISDFAAVTFAVVFELIDIHFNLAHGCLKEIKANKNKDIN